MNCQIPISIQKWIEKHPEVELIICEKPLHSAGDAYLVLGEEKHKYIKTLILQNRKTGIVIAAIIKGGSNISRKSIDESFSARSWNFIPKDQLEEISGFPSYGIPPICLKATVSTIFVDPRVNELDQVIALAGTPFCLLRMPIKFVLEDPRVIIKPVSIG